MNILKLTIGDYQSEDFAEFIFMTKLHKEDFYDENLNLTKKFMDWLSNNNPWILKQIANNHRLNIFWLAGESLDEIEF